MKYTIIEDCSPYYIRFTFDGIESIINYVSMISQTHYNIDSKIFRRGSQYSHDTLDTALSETVISMLPMSDKIDFNVNRVAIFNTPPGGGCGIHKDGHNTRTSFNIPLEILDDKCITYWYADDRFVNFPLKGDIKNTRNVYPDYKTMNRFTPIKTMIAKPNEMVLFNTDIYHSWNNVNSVNTRKMLTLRAVNVESLFFDDAKKIIFGSNELLTIPE